MKEHNLPLDQEPRQSTDQMLQLILGRLDRFPAERLVRMETELQQLRSLLEDEVSSRKGLAEDLQRVAREFGETMDKRMDRAFADCRQDRDLRLACLADRIAAMQCQDREERTHNVKMKVAVFSAVSAFVISIVNAVIGILARR